MASYAPGTDLWLERSRLDGMVLAAVSYGIFFLLTIQATLALMRKPAHGGETAHKRWVLLSYIWITFVLATLGLAGNARYTEMIWIDLRNASGGPTALILDELNYWINMAALTCYYIMEWLMQALLLHRCFILWDWKKRIIVPMSTLFAAMVAMSIVVLAEANGAIFYNINFELAYLCLQIGLTILYTALVAGRLFVLRGRMRDTLGREHVRVYETVAIMVIESAALYSVFGIIFIVSFAVHSNVSNLVLLSVSNVQGIAQLLIIIRAAEGRSFEQTSRTQLASGSVLFSSGRNYKPSNSTSQPGRTNPSVVLTDMKRGAHPSSSWAGEKSPMHSSVDYP